MKKNPEKSAFEIASEWLSHLKNPFDRLTEKQKFLLGFSVLTILTTIVIQNPLWQKAERYREGDILRESIISPSDITFVDERETERLRQEARSKIQPIFVVESNRSENAVQNFQLFWEKILQKTENLNTNIKLSSNKNSSMESLSDLSTEAEKVLITRKFTPIEIDAVTRALRESTEGYIYNDYDRQYLQNEVQVFDQKRPAQQLIQILPESNWIALSKAREKLKERIYNIKSFNDREKQAFYTILEKFVQPNVFYDADATEKAREIAAQKIAPVVVSLKRQQKVANEGEIVTADVLSKINAIESYTQSHRKWNRFFGILFLLAALYWIAWKYIETRSPNLKKTNLSSEKIFALFASVVIAQIILIAACFRIAEFTALQNTKAPLNDVTIWSFAVPFAFTSLSLALLVDKRLALFSGIFISLLAGLLAPRPIEFILYSVISSSVAVYGIKHYHSRSSLTSAGILTGMANSLITVAIIAYLQQPFVFDTIILSVSCGFLGGIAASAVTSVALPPLESIFGIMTDVKLLELSNTELPLLKQLALRAPGTNQHSHAVGQLAEDACRAIGANGLLAKIGALYHDIGKIAAPEHFVENQHGKNPHDKLKPSQSAKIIISHVTYGMKLAKEHKLPQIIADFIPQHHGTRTLHYFLKKAQAQASNSEEIDENDFRYSGPKPQFKEAAIMMIADSCEAAARSLAEPTPENLRFIVTKIIDAILADDQLDECDLTLRELTIIRESMIKSLIAIYHSRVEYPGYIPPQKNDTPKYTSPADVPISKGGEIEEEAIASS